MLGLATPFLKRSTTCLSKTNMLKSKFLKCVPQQMEPQPPTLAQTLNVVMGTCHEQRKLIWMLTQDTNQQKSVKLSEACYYCKGYNHPCLPNKVTLLAVCYCCVGYARPCLHSPPTNWTLVHNQGFGEHFQSSLIPPPVAPREENQHMVEIPAQGNNVPNMDLSNWDVTCTDFRPRKRRHRCFNCGK